MRRRHALAAVLSLGLARALSARAQQPGRSYRVGCLLAGTEAAIERQRRVIVDRLARHGFVEGRNLVLDVRIGSFNRTVDGIAARALVASRPDALLADTTPLSLRLREATDALPIVFTGVADPVGSGLVKQFARPGGNATGVHFSQLEIAGKRLELLRELMPSARRVMVAREIGGQEFDTLRDLHRAASRLGFELIEIAVNWSQGFNATLWASAYEKPDAIVSGQPWAIYGMEYIADQIIRFAAEQRMPSMFWEPEMVARGATVTYGVDLQKELGRAADQLARVLKGARPAELPVDQATHYELVVSAKAAGALDITIPPSILARARVVE